MTHRAKLSLGIRQMELLADASMNFITGMGDDNSGYSQTEFDRMANVDTTVQIALHQLRLRIERNKT